MTSFSFTAAELLEMRSAQGGHMMDTAIIQRHAYTANDLNEQVSTWTDDAASTIAGLSLSPGAEQRNADMTLLTYDATVRLPLTVAVDAKDRVKITHMFGEALAVPLVFGIAGPVQRGPSCFRLRLRKVDA